MVSFKSQNQSIAQLNINFVSNGKTLQSCSKFLTIRYNVIEDKIDYPGNNIKMTKAVENQEACAKLAAANEKAKFWTYRASTKECWIKTKKGAKPLKTVVSGNRECGL